MQFYILMLLVLIGLPLLAVNAERSSDPKVIILLGPPASGKGTQAKKLAKELNIPHISTGDILRENVAKDTNLGHRAKNYMDRGQLVPDELVLDMLFARVAQPDAENGYVLDGFPRTIPQAEALDDRLGNKVQIQVLNLKVKDETLIKRTAGRLSCPKCGMIHNQFFSPPRNDNKCDNCSCELTQRPDDKVEVVKERLKAYHAQTAPLITFYKNKGLETDIDGEQSPDQVFSDLKKALR